MYQVDIFIMHDPLIEMYLDIYKGWAMVMTLYQYSLVQPDSYTSGGGGRESGKVPYIELSQRLV